MSYCFPTLLTRTVALVPLLFSMTLTADVLPTDLLDRYTGKWEGYLRIYTTDDELLEEWTVSQHYWWEGTIQRALAVFARKGRLHYSESRIAVNDGRLVSRTYFSDERVRDYVGSILPPHSIVWNPADPNEFGQWQLVESIREEEDGTVLHLEGHENAVIDHRPTTLRLAGALSRESHEDTSPEP